VWVAADEQERAKRVAAREGVDPEVALAANRDRERSERQRYRTYYGIDLDDLSVYDLVIDSTGVEPAAVAESILAVASK
jgi:cytidylate kinase